MLDIKRIKEDPAAVKAGFHAKQVSCAESAASAGLTDVTVS